MPRFLAVLTLILSGAALNLRAAPAEQPPADPRAALLKLLPAGSKLDDLRPSPIPGIYEFIQGAEVSYMTADGKYFIDGNLYDMKSRDNLTEELRTHARVALINAVPESQMVIFSPANPQVHADRVYRRRLPVLQKTAQPDCRAQPPRACACAICFSRAPARDRELAQSRGGLVLGEPQRSADARKNRRARWI